MNVSPKPKLLVNVSPKPKLLDPVVVAAALGAEIVGRPAPTAPPAPVVATPPDALRKSA